MSEYIVIRDSRLNGNLPGSFVRWWHDLNVITTSASSSLRAVFNGVTEVHRRKGRIHTIFLLCHGFAGSSPNRRMSGDLGGQGLQLAREGVLHGNVVDWTQIQNKAANIVVYACAASNTESGNEFTTEDGIYLMGALAIHTNANVYAGDRIQWYSPSTFDFGRWEGNLLKFSPSGTAPVRVSRAPVEFNQLNSLI